MILSIIELIDIVIMTAFVGYIFMDFFKPHARMAYTDPVSYYQKQGFDWHSFKFAAMVTAPAIIFHEFAHKAVALSFGIQSVFRAAYFFLFLGVVLKVMGSNFIFFVPAYIAHARTTALNSSMIAIAGPLMNLVIFLIAFIVLKKVNLKKSSIAFWALTKRINLFLFIFNMLPIPGFDGYHFFSGLISAIF